MCASIASAPIASATAPLQLFSEGLFLNHPVTDILQGVSKPIPYPCQAKNISDKQREIELGISFSVDTTNVQRYIPIKS